MSGETEQQVIHYFKGDELGAARCGASVHPADHYRYSDRWPEVTCGGCRSHWSAPGSARLPAPDAAGIEAALAAGLVAHFGVTLGFGGWRCSGCGQPLGDYDCKEVARHAHVAAALLPVVTQAQAEALRGAADEVFHATDLSAGVPVYRSEIADWLRARADESGGAS